MSIVLDFVLSHAKDDIIIIINMGPYLKICIYGREFMALLDSERSRTVLGGPGWDLLKPICSLHPSVSRQCTVANGANVEVVGSIIAPIQF